MAESKAKPCEQKSTLSPKTTTIRQMLKTLKEELQRTAPSEITNNFLTDDIAKVEQEYKELTDHVDEYETAWLLFKESGSQYNTAKIQWNEIKKWENNSTLLDKTKQDIKKLREESYRDETEEPLNDAHPKKILENSKQVFRSIKSCYEQQQDEEKEISQQYDNEKKFKETAEGWFAALKDLHEQAKRSDERKKYRSVYAIYLEAEQVWQKINSLTSETPAAWKKKLTETLGKVLQAKDERFRWQQDWLAKEQDVNNADINNKTFETNRLNDFIREAEDVEAEDEETQNGKTENETGKGSATCPE
jgi:hypothetical protein